MQRLWKRSDELVDAATVRIRSCKFIECGASHSLPFLFEIYNWRDLDNEFRRVHKVRSLLKKQSLNFSIDFAKTLQFFQKSYQKQSLCSFSILFHKYIKSPNKCY